MVVWPVGSIYVSSAADPEKEGEPVYKNRKRVGHGGTFSCVPVRVQDLMKKPMKKHLVH
jgi:hypothetical protein